MKPAPGEAGYALVAAVASIAVFAIMALAIMTGTRAAIVQGGAEIARAHADAAADAGIALALQGMLVEDRAFRWSIDGRTRQLRFGDAVLSVRVEDERGKVPLASLEEEQAVLLFEALGLSGDRLDIVTDSFLDWFDDDDEARPNGAELDYYAARRIHARNGRPHTIDELALIRGFDSALVERLRPVATLDFGGGSFAPDHASPLAIGVMTEGGAGSPEAISRARELAGQRTAIELGEDIDLTGRPLTIVAEARTAEGGHSVRRVTLEISDMATRTYVVRASE